MSVCKIPAVLVCPMCSKVAKKNGWSPLNILLCNWKTHAHSRMAYSEFKKALDKYLGRINSNVSESTLSISSNFMNQAHGTGKLKEKINVDNIPVTPCNTFLQRTNVFMEWIFSFTSRQNIYSDTTTWKPTF